MIFVTVSASPFERLIKEMDRIAGNMKEKVIMQIGRTRYEPKNAEFFRFTTFKKIIEYNKKARVVVTHGGAGCIITALSFGKPVVVVPRYKRFNEHINDHQLDLTKALEKEKKIVAVYDIRDLEYAITYASSVKYRKSKPKLINFIKWYIKNLNK